MRIFKLSAVVLTLISASLIWSQSSTTSLSGTVTDPKGAVLTGATVTLADPQTGFSRSSKTDGTGAYQFLQIPPALYTISANASGFASRKENVRLLVRTPSTLNITMQVQGTEEKVEVTGEAPVVNTQDASLGNVFNAQQLVALPSEGRDPVAILSLQPGVTFIGSAVDQTNDSRSGSVSGARSDQANITLDGVDDNDQLFGNAFQGALRSTLDSLQEFRVTTTNSNADSGRSSGAQVNLVTKSGSNHLHGSLYEYNRSSFGTANDYFNKQAQLQAGLPNRPGQLIRNTFGGSIGGPIKKDRIFFFGTYEGQRTRESEQVTRFVPSANLRKGFISYVCTAGDPNCATGNPKFAVTQVPGIGTVATLTPAQFAAMDVVCGNNGTCPQGRGADPAVLQVFQRYPLPNSNNVGDLLNIQGFTFAGSHPRNLNTYIAKLDFKLTQNGNHSVFIRGNLQNDHESLPPQYPGLPANDTLTNNSRGLAASYTAVLSNTLINNFRYAFIREGLGDSGLNASDFVYFRGFDSSQGFTESTFTNVPVHNFVDDVTWTRGKHTFQFGGNLRLIHDNRASNAHNVSDAGTDWTWIDNAAIANQSSNPFAVCGSPGQCSLDPAGFSSLGYPSVDSSFGQSYDLVTMDLAGIVSLVNKTWNQDKTGAIINSGALIPRHFHSLESEWYVQDSWRVTPNLVLTGGLRYSLLQPPYEANGQQAAPTISIHDWFDQRGKAMNLGQTFDPTMMFDISGQANGKKPYWAWDYKDLAPRLAFAYSPHFERGFLNNLLGSSGKSSIRGGYGIYYDHFGETLVNTFDKNGSFGLTSTVTNGFGPQDVDCSARFTSLTTIPKGMFCTQNLIAPPPGKFPVTPPLGALAIYWGMDDKMKTPYSHVFDLSITRELPRRFSIEASYVGRLGRRLLQETDFAQPLDIRDPKSGMDYFTAATMFAKLARAGVTNVGKIPFWENIFPSATDPAHGISATQAMYNSFSGFLGDEIVALSSADQSCSPACASLNGGPPTKYQFFANQFGSLWAWRSSGNSSYNALNLSLRHVMSDGLQFDFNYTYSKSIDVGSNAERINLFDTTGTNVGGFSSQVINAWQPNQLRAVSDFDTTHQINSNWVYELPVGRGRKFGAALGGVAQAILGGWGISGLAHWTTGLPFSIFPGGGWSTNWNLQGESIQIGNPGRVGTFVGSGKPNIFENPQQAIQAFRHPYPGESGQRNELRGPGYFGIDTGISKEWQIKEGQILKFSWETFNLTNSVRFDAANSSNNFSQGTVTNFGVYSSTLTKPRVMQFMLRYAF